LGPIFGLKLRCRRVRLKIQVVGVRVASGWYITAKRFASIENRIFDIMGMADPFVPRVMVSEEDIILLEEYLDEGYVRSTEEGIRAVALMKILEGIPPEHYYTGKALGSRLAWEEGAAQGYPLLEHLQLLRPHSSHQRCRLP